MYNESVRRLGRFLLFVCLDRRDCIFAGERRSAENG